MYQYTRLESVSLRGRFPKPNTPSLRFRDTSWSLKSVTDVVSVLRLWYQDSPVVVITVPVVGFDWQEPEGLRSSCRVTPKKLYRELNSPTVQGNSFLVHYCSFFIRDKIGKERVSPWLVPGPFDVTPFPTRSGNSPKPCHWHLTVSGGPLVLWWLFKLP